jgi:hypothetical protein
LIWSDDDDLSHALRRSQGASLDQQWSATLVGAELCRKELDASHRASAR